MTGRCRHSTNLRSLRSQYAISPCITTLTATPSHKESKLLSLPPRSISRLAHTRYSVFVFTSAHRGSCRPSPLFVVEHARRRQAHRRRSHLVSGPRHYLASASASPRLRLSSPPLSQLAVVGLLLVDQDQRRQPRQLHVCTEQATGDTRRAVSTVRCCPALSRSHRQAGGGREAVKILAS